MTNAVTDDGPETGPGPAPDAGGGSDAAGVESAPSRGMRLPRSRGVVSGVLLVLAGIWAAFVPFVGPAFDFAYSPKPDETWHWTAARGWYEVLPGGLAFLGGLLLVLSANRIVTSFGAWIAALAGGWLVVGQQVSYLLTLGSPGSPAAAGDRRYVAEYLAFFTGLGAFVILVAAVAIGRLSVRSVRDQRAAARRDQQAALLEQETADREAAAQGEYQRAVADRAVTDRNADTWAAGEQGGGYGTPGTGADQLPADQPPVRQPPADQTQPLPVATSAQESASHDHAAGDYAAGPDDDTAAMPVVAQRGRDVDARGGGGNEEQTSRAADDEAFRRPVEPAQQEPTPPIVLEPPAGHPAAQPAASAEPERSPAEPEPEPAAPAAASAEPEPKPEPDSRSATIWNPEAQSPTTTGELPRLNGSEPPPEPTEQTEPAAAEPSTASEPPTAAQPAAPAEPAVQESAPAAGAAEQARRSAHVPRRYFGPGNPAPQDEQATPEPAPDPAPHRDAVRTDEGADFDDLDLGADIDERPQA